MIHFVIMLRFRVLVFLTPLVLVPFSLPLLGQTYRSTDSNRLSSGSAPTTTNSATSAARASQPSGAASGSIPFDDTATTGSNDSSASRPLPRITVAEPPVLPPTWSMQDRIAWGANLLLAFVGYAGIMLALRALGKIDRQTKAVEAVAESALQTANAALLNAQALLDAERPWILISIEPAPQMKNSFRIVATNRGRSPAEIIATADRIGIAVDEQHLPKKPEFAKEKPLLVPVVLVPGESTVIQPFGRDDVKWVCKTEENLRRIELWNDSIFLYGRLVYRSLIAPVDSPVHQTDWCCRYVHGESSSSLVMGGPPEYNKHINLARPA